MAAIFNLTINANNADEFVEALRQLSYVGRAPRSEAPRVDVRALVSEDLVIDKVAFLKGTSEEFYPSEKAGTDEEADARLDGSEAKVLLAADTKPDPEKVRKPRATKAEMAERAKVAETKTEPEPVTTSENSVVEQPTAEDIQYTLDDVKRLAKVIIDKDGPARVKGVIESVTGGKASSMSGIPAEKYSEVMAAFEAVLKA